MSKTTEFLVYHGEIPHQHFDAGVLETQTTKVE